VLRFADSITPTGCFSNHGGGLQDDGGPASEQEFELGRPGDTVGTCSGVFPFTSVSPIIHELVGEDNLE
jgi:hypothetical protein